jgi:phytoene dehydrogenase-like protein
VFEPDVAPSGKHIALCFTQFGPFEPVDGGWEKQTERYGQNVIATLGRHAPNLPDAVEHIEVLPPPEIERRFGLLGGNIFQGEMAPDQLFSLRPIPGYGDYRTPIDGLYMCGSGTHPGGGVMAVPGRNAASVIGRDLRRERFKERMRRSMRGR